MKGQRSHVLDLSLRYQAFRLRYRRGDNEVKLLKVKCHDKRSEVMMNGDFSKNKLKKQYYF